MRLFAAAVLTAMATFPLPASSGHAPDFAEMARLVQASKEAIGHPTGTAIAVIKDGKVVYEGYFGYADIQKRVPVDRNTGFYIASATKPFLALNVLLMEARGALDTGASLRTMFPRAAFDGIDADAVTVRNLLTHTSGIENEPLVWATAFSGVHDARSLQQLVAQSYPHDDTGHGTFRYTNVGYNIVSVWLDRKVGTPWQRQLDKNIFSPLGMEHTTAYISKARAAGWSLATPYSVQSVERNRPLHLEKSDETMQAAGGMVSTAHDLARFLMAQLGEGRVEGEQVLPAVVVAASQTQQAATEAPYQDSARSGYAWGWYTGEYKSRRMLHHFGGFAGFHAHLSFIPEARVGLVVLSNEDFLAAHVTNLIADHAYGLLLGEPGINEKVSARFDELLGKVGQLEATVASQRAEIHGRTWRLSLPLPAYVRTYSHPLLGDLIVSLDADGRPELAWGRLKARATPYDEKDHARVEFVPNSGQVVRFVVSGNAVRAIEFDRMTFQRAERTTGQ